MSSRDSLHEREFIVIIFVLLAANVNKEVCLSTSYSQVVVSFDQMLSNGSKSRKFFHNKVNVFQIENQSRDHSSLESFALM